MSGHHDATKPCQPRRGPERPSPEQPAEDEEAVAAAAAMAALPPQPEPGYEYGTGEAVPMDAAAAEGEHAQHEAMALTAGVPQPVPNTLTLSFQGEAFVFDNVSAEKVQAVFLLLGGKELPPGSIPGPSSSTSFIP